VQQSPNQANLVMSFFSELKFQATLSHLRS
jgi:hypothetical protein